MDKVGHSVALSAIPQARYQLTTQPLEALCKSLLTTGVAVKLLPQIARMCSLTDTTQYPAQAIDNSYCQEKENRSKVEPFVSAKLVTPFREEILN